MAGAIMSLLMAALLLIFLTMSRIMLLTSPSMTLSLMMARLVDGSLVVDVVDHVQDLVVDVAHDVLVDGSLVVDLVDHVQDLVDDVALDDLGVDGDVVVNIALDDLGNCVQN